MYKSIYFSITAHHDEKNYQMVTMLVVVLCEVLSVELWWPLLLSTLLLSDCILYFISTQVLSPGSL